MRERDYTLTHASAEIRHEHCKCGRYKIRMKQVDEVCVCAHSHSYTKKDPNNNNGTARTLTHFKFVHLLESCAMRLWQRDIRCHE